MEKEFNMGQIKVMYEDLMKSWDTVKDTVQLKNMKSLYNLIALKRVLEEHNKTLTEALVLMFQSNHCTLTEDGQGFQVPPEAMETVNQKYNELMKESVTIDYNEIVIHEGDVFPPALLEALFDFVSFAE